MNVKFIGINSRGHKCYGTGETFIEEVDGEFYLLNQAPEYGFSGIEGEPIQLLNKNIINIIE